MTKDCVDQISSGLCSTHPGCGNCWLKGRCDIETISQRELNRTAREEVVPWSSARMYLGFIGRLLFFRFQKYRFEELGAVEIGRRRSDRPP